MRKLKLQMQITVDGFVGGPEGQLDWMTWAMDESLLAFINRLTAAALVPLHAERSPLVLTLVPPPTEDIAAALKRAAQTWRARRDQRSDP